MRGRIFGADRILLPSPVSKSGRYPYTTAFPANENPISEGGRWQHTDPNQTVVKVETLGGVQVAHGTMAGGAFDDSSAYLPGFPKNHSIQGTIWKSASLNAGSVNHEVELLLRWSETDGAERATGFGNTRCDGYELNIHHNGNYFQLGRFKGVLLQEVTGIAAPGTGDVMFASIATLPNGTVQIIGKINSTTHINFIDTAPHVFDGYPGIGFFIHVGGDNAMFGFSSVTALALGE
jgi:hypothetical protein